MCLRRYKKFWCETKYKPVEDDVIVLRCIKRFFSVLDRLSCIRYKVWLKEKKLWSEEGVRYKRIRLYEAVDRYVLGWFAFEIVIFIAMLFFFRCDCKWFFIVPLIFIIYRLLEILQAWVSQFILGGVPVRGWKPLDVYRSLVLVCVGYVEIIFSYAFIVLFCWESFDGIEYGVKALHYSVSNAVTIGSDVVPRSWLGYTIFGTQVIFILLFITAVIGFIIGGITRDKGNTG